MWIFNLWCNGGFFAPPIFSHSGEYWASRTVGLDELRSLPTLMIPWLSDSPPVFAMHRYSHIRLDISIKCKSRNYRGTVTEETAGALQRWSLWNPCSWGFSPLPFSSSTVKHKGLGLCFHCLGFVRLHITGSSNSERPVGELEELWDLLADWQPDRHAPFLLCLSLFDTFLLALWREGGSPAVTLNVFSISTPQNASSCFKIFFFSSLKFTLP